MNRGPLGLLFSIASMVVSIFSTVLDLPLVFGFFALMILCALWLEFRSRRLQRIQGTAQRLTIRKTFAGVHWGRRDFAWGQIQGFETDLDLKSGHSDVFVQTNQGRRPLGLELLAEEADELAEALQKMKVRAKMETLARGGYRGRVPQEPRQEPDEVEIPAEESNAIRSDEV